jgi:type I restriction enzyme S subunit
MGEWKGYKLGEICTKIGSGATPKGGKESYLGGDTALIRSQNVLDFSFSWEGLAYISDEQAIKLKNVEVEKDDVLLNITGDSVARACMVPASVLPARVNQHVSIIRGERTKSICEYILYYLQYKKKSLIALSQGGATRNALTKGMLEEMIILLPDLEQQRTIVNVLKSFDDKIECNRWINDNLQHQAIVR